VEAEPAVAFEVAVVAVPPEAVVVVGVLEVAVAVAVAIENDECVPASVAQVATVSAGETDLLDCRPPELAWRSRIP